MSHFRGLVRARMRALAVPPANASPQYHPIAPIFMPISTFSLDKITYCRPEAYQYFIEQLPFLQSLEGLMRAAIAISMHALDDVDPQRVEQRLEVLSLRVRERAPS